MVALARTMAAKFASAAMSARPARRQAPVSRRRMQLAAAAPVAAALSAELSRAGFRLARGWAEDSGQVARAARDVVGLLAALDFPASAAWAAFRAAVAMPE